MTGVPMAIEHAITGLIPAKSGSITFEGADIRKTPGNADFRIDRCVDYLKVGFGFEDVAGHEFVFKKEMCYEPN